MSQRRADARTGRGRPRKAGAREAVIAACLDLVAEQGYAATSMDQVAERAGVAKSTIYRRWPSKDDLVIDAHRSLLPVDEPPDTGSLKGDLLALVEIATGTLEQPRFAGVLQASVGEMLANPALARVFREHVLEPRVQLFGTLFRRAMVRGEVPPELEWRQLAYAVIGSNIFRVAFMGEAPDRDWNRRMVAMLVREATAGGGDASRKDPRDA